MGLTEIGIDCAQKFFGGVIEQLPENVRTEFLTDLGKVTFKRRQKVVSDFVCYIYGHKGLLSVIAPLYFKGLYTWSKVWHKYKVAVGRRRMLARDSEMDHYLHKLREPKQLAKAPGIDDYQ